MWKIATVIFTTGTFAGLLVVNPPMLSLAGKGHPITTPTLVDIKTMSGPAEIARVDNTTIEQLMPARVQPVALTQREPAGDDLSICSI